MVLAPHTSESLILLVGVLDDAYKKLSEPCELDEKPRLTQKEAEAVFKVIEKHEKGEPLTKLERLVIKAWQDNQANAHND